MRKYAWLLAVVGVLLAGCGGNPVGEDPLGAMPQAEEDLKAMALALADEAEAQLQSTGSSGVEDPRSLTLVLDSEAISLFVSLKSWSPPEGIGPLFGRPLGLVIRCTRDGRKCAGSGWGRYLLQPELEGENQRMAWYGASQGGIRQKESVPLVLETGPAPGSPTAKQKWSYNRIGLGGFWADSLIQLPDLLVEMRYPLPTSLPGEEPTRFLDPSSFLEALRRACCGLPKPFPVEWPPAVLLRPELSVALMPYQNPRLGEATGPDDLLDTPLAILYLRMAGTGAKLTKADAARIMEVRLVREELDYLLVATNLKDPSDVLRFRVNQPGWCDGCWHPGMPTGVYVGIEDRLGGPPVLHLQVGPLLLQGIEKR